nr:reverse transcriptase domain-containing protein [Tanacetum cinerariifolium]
AARQWLEKEPPQSITTWEDLISKFINKFFPPSRTTSLCNEISNFQQKFDESFHEAWDRYKDFLRACSHHGFTELHQLNNFYNALNPTDQDSLNAAAGGNLLEKSTQDVLAIIENKSKVRNSRSKLLVSQVKACDTNSNSEIAKLTHAVSQQTNAVTTAMTAMLTQFQATPPPAPVKVVEEICVTCGGAHPYYQFLATGGNTFLEFRDNIQGYVSSAVVNYNQGNPGYRSQGVANQIRPPGSGSLPSNTVASPKGELKAITTRSGLVTDGRTVPTPPKSITPEVDERVEETYTDPDLAEYTIKVPPPPPSGNPTFLPRQELTSPEVTNDIFDSEGCNVLSEKLPDLNYTKDLHPPIDDNLLSASINLMPLSVWKELGLPELIPTCMTLKLANRAICTPAEIAKDVFVPVGKFTFPPDFVIVDYESDHRPSGNPTFLPRQELTSPEVTNDIFDSEGCNVLSEKLPDLNYTKDLHPPIDDNLLSDSTTYSFNSFLEEFTDELALIHISFGYDDNLQFDIKSDLKEIEFMLYQDKDSSLKDSIDQKGFATLDAIFVDPILEMFTDEHTLDYSSPLKFDVYDDDFLEVESDAKNVYDDPFDSKERKSKSLNS